MGALVATAGHYVDGLRLVFMRRKTGKLEGETLDPADSYTSRWVGGRGGAGDARIGGDGRPVVGLHGMAEDKVRGIGVIQPRPAVSKPDSNASPLLRDCLLLMPFEPDTFLEEAGTRYVRDLSGKDNWGTVQGASPAKEGKAGSAIHLDGKDDCIVVPSLRRCLTRDLKSLTISLWAKHQGTNPRGFILDAGGDMADAMKLVYYDRIIIFWVPGNQLGTKKVESDRWYHVAGVWDGTQMHIYQDGRAVGNKKTPGGLAINESNLADYPERIGTQAKPYNREGRGFEGLIDEVGIWSRALSDEEIGKLFQMGQKGEPLGR